MRRLVPVLALAATSLSLLGADGCDETKEVVCHLQHVECGFSLALEGASDTNWVVTGSLDGEAFRCSIGATYAWDTCDRDDVRFDLRPPGALLYVNGTPAEVEVIVQAGDAVLLAERFEPAYVTDEPNGEGCGLCTSASVTRPVPAP